MRGDVQVNCGTGGIGQDLARLRVMQESFAEAVHRRGVCLRTRIEGPDDYVVFINESLTIRTHTDLSELRAGSGVAFASSASTSNSLLSVGGLPDQSLNFMNRVNQAIPFEGDPKIRVIKDDGDITQHA